MSLTQGRLIPLDSGDAAENMAIDQALLESVGDHGRPTLRLYTWTQPTLSLGYFQPIGARRDHAESETLACVRRSTGGGAIVHHHELTYSVALPLDRERALPGERALHGGRIGPSVGLYQQTHAAVAAALSEFNVRAVPFRSLGRAAKPKPTNDPFLCFQRSAQEDLFLSGYKILGSAQRKGRRAILQHGSLLLGTSPWAPQLPGVRELTSQSIPLQPLAESLATALATLLSIHWITDEISRQERLRAEQIVVQRFASDRWLGRR